MLKRLVAFILALNLALGIAWGAALSARSEAQQDICLCEFPYGDGDL